MKRRWCLWFVCLLAACGTEAAPEPEPVETPAERVPWPAVHTTDGVTELRALVGERVVLLRRVDDTGWVRGWAGPTFRYRRQRQEAVYAGFWMHASSLRARLDGDAPVMVADVQLSAEMVRAFIGEAGADVDSALFESEEHEGRFDYVIRQEFAGPGVEAGFRCEAELLIRPQTPPAGVLTVEQLQVGGPARAPIDAPILMWLEDAEGTQTRLRRGVVPLPQLGALAGAEGLQLCSVDCCIRTSEADRERIQTSVAQGTALAEQIAARPRPDPFRRASLPPLP